MRATVYASIMHEGQTRKSSGEPYVMHPLAVMTFLREDAKVADPAVLAAAVLHDVVEDTAATVADIRAVFGEEVAGYVAEVSDDRALCAADRKLAQVAHAAHLSRGAKLIKCADMWHNLSDLRLNPPAAWPHARVRGYFAWKCVIYARHMVGVHPVVDAALRDLFNIEDGHYWRGGTRVRLYSPDTTYADVENYFYQYIAAVRAGTI